MENTSKKQKKLETVDREGRT